MSLNREQFQKLPKTLATRVVKIPGGEVICRQLTEAQSEIIDAANWQGGKFNPVGRRIRLVIAGAINEAGQPLFTNDDAADLAAMPANFIAPLADAIAALTAGEPVEGDSKNAGGPADAVLST
jgi:hypothetical protein